MVVQAYRIRIGETTDTRYLRRVSVPTDSLPLLGREESLARLAALTEAVRAGAGGAIRVEGTPGVGKSALLEAAAPSDLTVLRAVGVEAEAGIPLGGPGGPDA